MGDLEAKLIRKITLNGKDVDVFLNFNVEEYGEKEFSDGIMWLQKAYTNKKKPPELKRNRALLRRVIEEGETVFSEKPEFRDFEQNVEKFFIKYFIEPIGKFAEDVRLAPEKITCEISRAIEDGLECVATVDEKNSTESHYRIKFNGRSLVECFFPLFFLNGSSLNYIEKQGRHEAPHLLHLFTINKVERVQLKKLEELDAPHSARKLCFLLYELLKEAGATIYEFEYHNPFKFKSKKITEFRGNIMEMCRQKNASAVDELYDKKIDVVDVGIYRHSLLAAYIFASYTYLGSANRVVEKNGDALVVANLPQKIKIRFIKESAYMHPLDFLNSCEGICEKKDIAEYCPLNLEFVESALEESLAGLEDNKKKEIKNIFFEGSEI